MPSTRRRQPNTRACIVALLALCTVWSASAPATEQRGGIDHWRVQTSVLTRHFDPEPEHNETQKLINLEAWRDARWHVGAAVFQNSYDQPTQYVYVGYLWPIGERGRFYWRLTGGLMHGYKDEYQDKIPFNGLGIAPAIVPSVGVRYRRAFSEVQFGGTAVAMWTAGVRF